jgi:hypothetical protein
MKQFLWLIIFMVIAIVGASISIFRPAPALKPKPKKTAIVIAATRYRHMDTLGSIPINDATAIKAELESEGFVVTLIVDPDSVALQRALVDFNKAAAGSVLSLVYFSGHGFGVQDASYILPIDVNLRSAKHPPAQFSLKKIKLGLDTCKIENCITVLDNCRSKPPRRMMKKLDRLQLKDTSYLVHPFLSIASCAPIRNSFEKKSDQYSIFTKFFLINLRYGNKNKLSIDEIFHLTNKNVRDSTDNKQIPEINGSLPEAIHLYEDSNLADQLKDQDSTVLKASGFSKVKRVRRIS